MEKPEPLAIRAHIGTQATRWQVLPEFRSSEVRWPRGTSQTARARRIVAARSIWILRSSRILEIRTRAITRRGALATTTTTSAPPLLRLDKTLLAMKTEISLA